MSSPQWITVFRVVAKENHVCDLGYLHEVPVYYQKFLSVTSRVRINPNHGGVKSYSDTKHTNPIYEDAQGRDWDVYYPVDYSSGAVYVGPDGERWTTREPVHGVRADKIRKATS